MALIFIFVTSHIRRVGRDYLVFSHGVPFLFPEPFMLLIFITCMFLYIVERKITATIILSIYISLSSCRDIRDIHERQTLASSHLISHMN